MADQPQSAWLDSVTPSCPPSPEDRRRMSAIKKRQHERAFLTLDQLMFLWGFELSLMRAQGECDVK